MSMREANRPETEYRFVVVDLGASRGKVARLRIVTGDENETTLWSQSWPAGRPTPQDLELLALALCDEVSAAVAAKYGVQGVLTT